MNRRGTRNGVWTVAPVRVFERVLRLLPVSSSHREPSADLRGQRWRSREDDPARLSVFPPNGIMPPLYQNVRTVGGRECLTQLVHSVGGCNTASALNFAHLTR